MEALEQDHRSTQRRTKSFTPHPQKGTRCMSDPKETPPQDETLEQQLEDDLDADEESPWLMTEDQTVLCTLDYRGVAVTLTSAVLDSKVTSLGYRYVANGEHFDDGLDLDEDLSDLSDSEAFDMLREIYEGEINELFKLSYPWQEGDKGVWNGKVVTVTGPFDQGYLYILVDGERVTTLAPAVDPVPPARKLDL